MINEILSQYPIEQLKSQCPLHALAKFDVCWQYDKFKDFLGSYDLDSGYTAMMVCCINNSSNMFKKLRYSQEERHFVTYKTKTTALMLAAQYGFSEGVAYLMKEDSVLYRRDVEMRTALSYIAYDHENKLQNDILFKLIWKLINVDQKAISYCIEEGNKKYFDLMKTQCNQNHIHAALKYNFPRAIEYYLEKDRS